MMLDRFSRRMLDFSKQGVKMRKILAALFLITALVLVSCATEANPWGLNGVWEAEDEYEKYIFSFTADGYYAYECYYDDILGYVSFGTYEADDAHIYTDDADYDYFWDGNNLILDFLDNMVFVRKSRTARNNTSPAKLKGVWGSDFGLAGFSANGTFVTMGYYATLEDYTAEGDVFKIGEDEYPYLIINSKLYIEDDHDLFGGSYKLVFERKTSDGKDQTSKEILTLNNPWHLTDMSDGDDHYVYTFNSNGRYKLEYYNDYNTDEWTSEGKYSYSGHKIELSEDGNLAYVIIDLRPFMFSI